MFFQFFYFNSASPQGEPTPYFDTTALTGLPHLKPWIKLKQNSESVQAKETPSSLTRYFFSPTRLNSNFIMKSERPNHESLWGETSRPLWCKEQLSVCACLSTTGVKMQLILEEGAQSQVGCSRRETRPDLCDLVFVRPEEEEHAGPLLTQTLLWLMFLSLLLVLGVVRPKW